MKKFLSLFITIALLLTLAACGGDTAKEETSTPTDGTTATETGFSGKQAVCSFGPAGMENLCRKRILPGFVCVCRKPLPTVTADFAWRVQIPTRMWWR